VILAHVGKILFFEVCMGDVISEICSGDAIP
jgi:hypothetical protein